MSKIEEIEKLLRKWKADSKKAYKEGDYEYEKLSMDRAIALESAIKILKEPSNTQMQIDATEPCMENCVAPSKKCDYFKTVGCRWHN